MRKSKLIKQTKKVKLIEINLATIVREDHKHLNAEQLKEYAINNLIPCGYMNKPYIKDYQFNGDCSITKKPCQYPHENYNGCLTYYYMFDRKWNNNNK